MGLRPDIKECKSKTTLCPFLSLRLACAQCLGIRNLSGKNDSGRARMTGCVALLMTFLVTAWCLLFTAVCRTEAAINRIEVEGLSSVTREELLYLLDLKEGAALNPQSLRSGIKRAFIKGNFEDIKVVEDDEDKTRVTVFVLEKDFIKNISISGNEHLSGPKIKERFLLKEGLVMRYDLLDGAVNSLKEYLVNMGFPEVKVSAVVSKTSTPYSVSLKLRIDEGRPLIINNLFVQGAALPDITGQIEVGRGDVYDRFAVAREVENIVNHYKGLGYLNPEVSYSYHNGTLDLLIKEGRKLAVIFKGNEIFDAAELMREMPFFEAGELRDDLMEDASRRIRSLYRKRGYFSAQASVIKADNGAELDNTSTLHFYIYEGNLFKVGSIDIAGSSLSQRNLKEMLSLREHKAYNPETLPYDLDILKEFYLALGYLGAEVLEPEVTVKGNVVDIKITIKEGPQTLIEGIEINGAKTIPAEVLKKAIALPEGSPYNEVDLADARYRVMERYLERGFMDVEVHLKRELDAKRAKITFEINEGTQVFFGKTIISGNERTKTKVLTREFFHTEGMPFNYSLLIKERQKLYKLGLFTEVSIEPLEKHEGRRDVLLKIAEGNAGAVETGLGFGDYEKYRGYLDISYKNLFGVNRYGSVRAELSSLERRYMINYHEPWFLDNRIPFRVFLLREEKTEKNIDTKEIRYRLKRNSVTAGFEKRLSSEFKGELYYEFSLVSTFDVKPDVILTREDTGTIAISGIRPGIIYDTRDNPFDPRRGLLAGVTLKVASNYLFSETDFAKVVFNVNYYKELSKSLVMAFSFRGGTSQGFGSTRELPLVERFFLGGRNTVRGYAQDSLGPKGSDGTPTGGNAFLMTNLELRVAVGKNLGVVAFFDGGNVWVKTSDMRLSFKYTIGAGLRYSTPVGPLRIDYGRKLRRDEGESGGELHFSIGHAF